MKLAHRINTSGGLRLALLIFAVSTAFAGEPYRPVIIPANFTHVVDNPYFPLVPGTITLFIEKAGREKREIRVVVTHETKTVMGVKCVVVHDTVTLDDKRVEDTYDWYAQDMGGAVWYFGEATKEFKSGGRVITEGSWPGEPTVPSPYRAARTHLVIRVTGAGAEAQFCAWEPSGPRLLPTT